MRSHRHHDRRRRIYLFQRARGESHRQAETDGTADGIHFAERSRDPRRYVSGPTARCISSRTARAGSAGSIEVGAISESADYRPAKYSLRDRDRARREYLLRGTWPGKNRQDEDWTAPSTSIRIPQWQAARPRYRCRRQFLGDESWRASHLSDDAGRRLHRRISAWTRYRPLLLRRRPTAISISATRTDDRTHQCQRR